MSNTTKDSCAYKIEDYSLENFIKNFQEYKISNKAKFSYFRHKGKIENLKYFIV